MILYEVVMIHNGIMRGILCKSYKIAVVVSKKPEVIQFDDNKKPTIRKLEDVIII